MQPQAAAYQLMCCSNVAYGRGKSLSSAHVNRMQKKADLSAIRHSFSSCWNVAAASAWSSCLCCRATSLATTQCSCKSVIQQCCAAQLGLNKPRICPWMSWRERTAGQNGLGDSTEKLSFAQTLLLECCYFLMGS